MHIAYGRVRRCCTKAGPLGPRTGIAALCDGVFVQGLGGGDQADGIVVAAEVGQVIRLDVDTQSMGSDLHAAIGLRAYEGAGGGRLLRSAPPDYLEYHPYDPGLGGPAPLHYVVSESGYYRVEVLVDESAVGQQAEGSYSAILLVEEELPPRIELLQPESRQELSQVRDVV